MPEATVPSSSPDSGASAADFDLARQALLDVTTADTIGDPAGSVTEADGVVTVYFATTMAGYPGWRWTVSLVRVDGAEPSVLETELTPGDGALLSPDWVPWADRLADYKEAQAAGLVAEGPDDELDDDDDDEDDDDEDDLLHAGDLDGVDIDEDALGEESAALPVGDDETDESEGESDDAGPQPPRASRRGQRGKRQQQDDEGE